MLGSRLRDVCCLFSTLFISLGFLAIEGKTAHLALSVYFSIHAYIYIYICLFICCAISPE